MPKGQNLINHLQQLVLVVVNGDIYDLAIAGDELIVQALHIYLIKGVFMIIEAISCIMNVFFMESLL